MALVARARLLFILFVVMFLLIVTTDLRYLKEVTNSTSLPTDV